MGFTSNALMLTAADILSEVILSIFLYTVIISAGVEVTRMAFTKEGGSFSNSLLRVKSSMLFGFIPYAFLKLSFTSHLNLAHMSFADP